MTKPVTEPVKQSRSSRKKPVSAGPMPETPVEELVETLRVEFSRGLLLEAAHERAARRRRSAVMIASLAVLAGVVITAALVEITIRRSH
jgi:hypothetical protein